MTKHYCGIGSRKCPLDIQELMTGFAKELEALGYTLRSGGAQGADKAFERGVTNPSMKEIFYANDCEDWCLEKVSKYVPENRPPLKRMKPFIQRLLGRNMKQLFGNKGDSPVNFVVCWTQKGLDDGGTGYNVRCAKDHRIPVFNIRNKDELLAFTTFLKNLS